MIELLSNAGFIMYSKKAARLFGVNGAILLGELCAKYQYWLDNGGLLENEGWFFCTREDIEADTMLSSFQQREAMRALTENAVLGTKLMGMPSRTYYRINADVLYTMMSRNLTLLRKRLRKRLRIYYPLYPLLTNSLNDSGLHIQRRLRSQWRKRLSKSLIHPQSLEKGFCPTLSFGRRQKTGQRMGGNIFQTRPRISISADGRTKSRCQGKRKRQWISTDTKSGRRITSPCMSEVREYDLHHTRDTAKQ